MERLSNSKAAFGSFRNDFTKCGEGEIELTCEILQEPDVSTLGLCEVAANNKQFLVYRGKLLTSSQKCDG